MAGKRTDLHDVFIGVLGTTDQSPSRVYFQPPATIELVYPCIIYKQDGRKNFFSNGKTYVKMNRYTVTVVDEDPDSEIRDKVLDLPFCSQNTSFAVDGLNHSVYTLYF